MAFKHGSNTEIWVDGADVSSYFRQLDVSVDVDTAETTTFKKTWKTHLAGDAAGAVQLDGLYDPTFGDIRALVPLDAGAIVTTGPAGLEAVGDLARLGKVLSVSYAESSAIGDVVLMSFGVTTDGALGFGEVLAPLAAVTAGANGSTHTGPVGGTTNGAIAHLHVTSVSASDTLDVHIEDSANGTDWLDVAGAAFTTASAAGAQRLAIAGTIRRYTRAVWAVTGTDVSITFAVAIARL